MGDDPFLEPHRRPLTAPERRLLRARSASLRSRGRRASSVGMWIGAVMVATLWALTMIASDAPALVITSFWLVAGAAIMLWVRREFGRDRRQYDAIATGLQSALRHDLADVYDIRSTAFVEFEEVEDEGACYAFQLQDRQAIIFLSGQQYYEESRFPSLDFSLVFPLDEAGNSVDMLIAKRGAKAAPQRQVPRSVKQALSIPEDLRIVTGTLDDLQQMLGGSPI